VSALAADLVRRKVSEIAVLVPVMNEVQFLFASEPCKPPKP
jgi:hypothetical protein